MPPKKKTKDLARHLEETSCDWKSSASGVLFKVPATLSDGSEKNCYFVTDGTVKFRHQGDDRLCPPKFYLKGNINNQGNDDKVMLYFTSSGSGKTVELAASSVTRESDLALLLSANDSDELVKAQEAYEKVKQETKDQDSIDGALAKRQEAVKNVLREKITSLTSTFKTVVLECISFKEDLQIVLCLDEVFTCSVLVRGIIADRHELGKFVASKFFGENSKAQVLFSCGGTGGVRASVGSLSENFSSPEPSTSSFVPNMFDESLAGTSLLFPDGISRTVNFEAVRDHFPIVEELLSNGRMNSIAALILKGLDADKKINEALLINDIIKKFISSNGVGATLTTPEQQQVGGACALATILFQHDEDNPFVLPNTDVELEKLHSEGFCGIEFGEPAKKLFKSNVARHLMGRLGLIEPNKDCVWGKGEPLQKPFKLSAPQELVALKLLGIDLTKLFELSPSGYEVLTTHVIKCALAAASVVDLETRPTVQATLKKIGFMPQAGLTDASVIKAWQELDDWQPVFHSFKREATAFRETHFMSVELEAIEDIDGEAYCQIDNELFKIIRDIQDNQDRGVWAPLASLNYGNSSLFDGCVIILMQHKVDANLVRFTIMNQSKDYTAKSILDLHKIRDHATRCHDNVFNEIFGEMRLLCLSARETVVTGERVSKYGRAFVPFVVNKSKILGALLRILDEKRTGAERRNTHARIIDKKGKDVTEKFERWI